MFLEFYLYLSNMPSVKGVYTYLLPVPCDVLKTLLETYSQPQGKTSPSSVPQVCGACYLTRVSERRLQQRQRLETEGMAALVEAAS